MAYYFDDLETLRIKAGLTKSELARESGVDRGTITKIERHHSAKQETLAKIGNTLNDLHYGKNGRSLNVSDLITIKSRFGGK